MPIPWLLVLKSVPWTEVIKNAPKVADGAKRLWKAVGKKKAPPANGKTLQREGSALPATELQTDADLRARLAALEANTAELHEQMLASSELIKTLAEQNAELVAGIEANRARLAGLSAVTAALVAALVLALIWLASGRGS